MTIFAKFQTPQEYAAGAGEEAKEELEDLEFKWLDDLVDVSVSFFWFFLLNMLFCYLKITLPNPGV